MTSTYRQSTKLTQARQLNAASLHRCGAQIDLIQLRVRDIDGGNFSPTVRVQHESQETTLSKIEDRCSLWLQ